MSRPIQTATNDTPGVDIDAMATSFARHLRAENRSPLTINAGPRRNRPARVHIARSVGAPELGDVTKADIECFQEDQSARWRPVTAANRYRGLRQFFRWLVDEGEITANPMAGMRQPRVPEAHLPQRRRTTQYTPRLGSVNWTKSLTR